MRNLMMSLNILVVEDNESSQILIKDILLSERHACKIAGSADKARQLLEESPECNMAVLDLGIPKGDKDYQGIEKGFSLLEYISNTYPHIYIIVLTASDRIEHSVRAIKLGAYDYLTKPIDLEILKKKLNQVRQIISLKEENIKLRQKTEFGEIIGESKEINDLLLLIKKVAPTEHSVIIEGETGTGKELVASAIHQSSMRRGEFITVNCAAIPDSLLENELFGHEEGAYTSAKKIKKGQFELADKGTIFLDEIGDMPLNTQAKLLRVIEGNQFMRVGGEKYIKIDVRVLAATHKNLESMAEKNTFRDDLLYRLNTFTIRVPHLRERKSDIPLLVEHFLERYSKGKMEITSEAMMKLKNYKWTGNVRELENVVKRGCVLAKDENTLHVKDLNFNKPKRNKENMGFEGLFELPLREAEEKFEKKYLENALKLHDNNKSEAAQSSKIDKSNFHKLLKKHNL